MTAEQFKNNSKVTYVRVEGKPSGYVVSKPKELCFYKGYIEVPYSHEDFISFNEKQRKAICEAELCKSGLFLEITKCNPNSFFEEKTDGELSSPSV